MNVLVTGGAGYIGSHTVVELLRAGYDAVVADDLSNAKADVINRIEAIVGKRPAFYAIDVKDREGLRRLFSGQRIDAVIHFAGFKAVGESVKKPLKYYRNNLDTTMTLLETMEEFDCKKFVFSSSATVYGPEILSLCGDDAGHPILQPLRLDEGHDRTDADGLYRCPPRLLCSFAAVFQSYRR